MQSYFYIFIFEKVCQKKCTMNIYDLFYEHWWQRNCIPDLSIYWDTEQLQPLRVKLISIFKSQNQSKILSCFVNHQSLLGILHLCLRLEFIFTI